jgi:uncharacterized protein
MEKPIDWPAGGGYWNPYLAGVLLGFVLIASYLVLGAGLGASGGIARIAAFAERTLFPGHVADSEYFGAWGESPLTYYLVFMFVGVVFGGGLSALLARRQRLTVERGRAFPASRRLWLALGGGLLVGFASRLAAGCTSGQALAGGALLLNGSLLFLVSLFAGGYATARLFRRQWHD